MNSIKKVGKQISDAFFNIKNKIYKSTKTNNENSISKIQSNNYGFYKGIDYLNWYFVLK